MSDLMLHGVLRMPLDLWSDEYLFKSQMHSRCLQASDRILEQESEIAALKAQLAAQGSEESNLRRLLFFAHGNDKHLLYGDDGELQCSACMCDFKRDSADDLHEKILKYNHANYKPITPPEDVK